MKKTDKDDEIASLRKQNQNLREIIQKLRSLHLDMQDVLNGQ